MRCLHSQPPPFDICFWFRAVCRYIHKAKRVKRKVVKKWCRQILDGLSFLHARRFVPLPSSRHLSTLPSCSTHGSCALSATACTYKEPLARCHATSTFGR